MRRILLFGDSNTYGWRADGGRYPESVRYPGVMRAFFKGEAAVFEDGVPGRSASGAARLQRVRSAVRDTDPDLLVLMIGTNDCEYADPERLRASVSSLIDQAREEKPCLEILLAVPPALDPNHTWTDMFSREGTRLTGAIPAIYRSLAEEKHTHFLDTGNLNLSHQEDGVHIDARSHRILGEALAGAVEKIK